MNNTETVARQLAKLRANSGETQEAVAESVGINCISLSRYENGQRMPKMDILLKLADHYGVSVDEIMRDEKKEAAQGGEIDERLREILLNLSPEEFQRVTDFLAGLRAAHRE